MNSLWGSSDLTGWTKLPSGFFCGPVIKRCAKEKYGFGEGWKLVKKLKRWVAVAGGVGLIEKSVFSHFAEKPFQTSFLSLTNILRLPHAFVYEAIQMPVLGHKGFDFFRQNFVGLFQIPGPSSSFGGRRGTLIGFLYWFHFFGAVWLRGRRIPSIHWKETLLLFFGFVLLLRVGLLLLVLFTNCFSFHYFILSIKN